MKIELSFMKIDECTNQDLPFERMNPWMNGFPILFRIFSFQPPTVASIPVVWMCTWIVQLPCQCSPPYFNLCPLSFVHFSKLLSTSYNFQGNPPPQVLEFVSQYLSQFEFKKTDTLFTTWEFSKGCHTFKVLFDNFIGL